jgi:tetratricopeptide (TPR) repeat protein
MPRYHLRRRWFGIIMMASISGLCGLSLLWNLLPSDPIKQGWAAFARGEWNIAAELARGRLKADDNDKVALRLLARSLVQLGRDSSAMAVYSRLGQDSLAADDFYLLGIALTRTGDPRGIKVWEQAHIAAPNHPEILFELTRAYLKDDRLVDAAVTARQLAECPGWKSQADSLLGTIELAHDNPDGALTFWRQVLERKTAEKGTDSAVIAPKELARILLRTHQPAEARLQLEQILSSESSAECFWLLSRAYLNLGLKTKALATWQKSGSFRDDNPLMSEPSSFIGSKRCAECHSAIFQSQQNSRHAHTFFRASELGNLILPPSSLPDPGGQEKVTHTLKKVNGRQLQQETHVENQVYSAIVEYALGSGDRGLTLVGRGDKGRAFELRLSRYRSATGSPWDVTSGHIRHPHDSMLYLGEPLSEDDVRRCLNCHVTSAQAVFQSSGPGSSDQGIGCEKCHGPGENHILAVEADFPDLAIIDPRMASGSPIVALCAQCHSPRTGKVSFEDPSAVRFPGTTLTWSRCFLESQNKLDCITCHDPHRDVATSASHYEAKCLSCHSATVHVDHKHTLAEPNDLLRAPAGSTACPVNSSKGCIGCHMPLVKNVVPHSSFTDHFIRVHRE